jgi:hypothetical protein
VAAGVTIDGVRVASWIAPRLRWARQHGWRGRVVSGIRSRRLQAQLYAEWQRGERAGPVARPGTSNHEGTRFPRGAVDVTDGDGLELAMRSWTGAGAPLVPFGAGDRPHFSATGR